MKRANVAEIMEVRENKILASRLHEMLDRDVLAEKMMEKAREVKDVYEVIKRHIAVKFEDFKYALNDTIAYLAPPKLALADADMEYVIGGGFWSSVGGWFKKHWKAIVITAAVVAAVAIGAGVAVACLGGVAAAAGGAGAVGAASAAGAAAPAAAVAENLAAAAPALLLTPLCA